MTIIAAFLAGMAVIIAGMAVLFALGERRRAEQVEALHAEALLEHGKELARLAKQDLRIAESLAAVASAASGTKTPFRFLSDGPRTPQ